MPAEYEWTTPLRPAPHAACRLVVFPHAGAGGLLYGGLLSGLPDQIEVLCVTLPGRDHRRHERPTVPFSGVLAAIGDELRSRPPLPTAYYGHSMGALLATHLAHADPGRCDAIVLSAAIPGPDAIAMPAALDSPEGLELLFARYRVPMAGLDADRARNRAEYLLAHDLVLARNALVAMAGVRLSRPLSVFGGADDPLVPIALMGRWRAFTSAPFRSSTLAGGHFFPFQGENARVLRHEIASVLTQCARNAPSQPAAAEEVRRPAARGRRANQP